MSVIDDFDSNPSPCPFCGSIELEINEDPVTGDLMVVTCFDCQCDGPPGVDEEMAIQKWSNRQLRVDLGAGI